MSYDSTLAFASPTNIVRIFVSPMIQEEGVLVRHGDLDLGSASRSVFVQSPQVNTKREQKS